MMQGIVELRNYTGIMLIDRNDELCVLYERYNVQEQILTHGNTELDRLADEARILHIEVAELERSTANTKKLLPKIPTLDMDVAGLQAEILRKQREVAELEMQV